MRIILVLLSLILYAQRTQSGTDKVVKNRVIYELNDRNIKVAVEKNEFVIICFYSSKSRTSREFEQTYLQVAQDVRRETKFIHFARIDVTRYSNVERDYNIRELPMLKFYKNRRHYDFIGEKTVKHITTWVHMAMNTPYFLSSTEQLNSLKDYGTVILGCFPDKKPQDEYTKFINASMWFVSAKYMPLPMFAIVEEEDAMYQIGVDKGSVTVFKNFDNNETVTYKGLSTDSDRLLRFCEDESQPVVFPYGKKEFSLRLTMGDVKHQHLLFMNSRDSSFKVTYNNFRTAAKSYMSTPDDIQVLFIYVDTSQSGLEKVTSFFHVDVARDVPCNRMAKLDDYGSRFAPAQKDLSKDGFTYFTRQVLQGNIRRTTTSENLPSDWNHFPLKVLVGSNYERVTRSRGNIAFVMYHIPNNEACNKVFPILDEVAMKYRDNSSVTIATMDVSKNDAEMDAYLEFPSFKMFTSDNTVIKFTGTQSVDAIKAFIDSSGVTHIGRREPLTKKGSIYQCGGDAYNFYDDTDALSYTEGEKREEFLLPVGKHNIENETNMLYEISDEGLTSIIKHADFYVVCFYSDTSRTSQQFQPKFHDVVPEVHKTNPYIRFAKLDVDKYKQVEKKYEIDELPFLKFYKHGRHYDYRGILEVANITNWVHTAMNLPLIISSSSDFELIKKEGSTIVGCFPGEAPAVDFKHFLNASAWFVSGKNLPVPIFAVVNTARMMREIGLAKGSVSIFKCFNNGEKAVYGGAVSDLTKLLKFCEEESQPIVFPHGNKKYSYILSRRDTKLQHLLIMDPKDYKFKETLRNFKAAAKKFRRSQDDIDVLFIHVDPTKKDVENLVAFFHVDIKKDVPCNRIARPDEFHSRFVPQKKDFSEQGFIDFTKGVLDGKIPKTVRSANLPSDWDKYTLKILVGKNYEQVTRKSGQTVFVMYYVPQNENSKKMFPVMEEVAMRFRNNKTVTIATMDVSMNDGEIDVFQEIPSFKMFTTDNKVIRFNGTRTIETIEAFINTNGESETDDSPGEEAVFEFQKLPEEEQRNPDELRYEEGEKRENMWTQQEFKSIEDSIAGSQGLEDQIQKEHPNKAVYELTAEDFVRLTKEAPFLVVCFYSKESRASTEFDSTYFDVAAAVHKENKYITFTKMDILEHNFVKKKYPVRELPMLRFYKFGRFYEFVGEKTVKHITSWIHMAMNSPYMISKKDVWEDLKKTGTTIVGCFPDEQPKEEYHKFLNASAFFVSGKSMPLPAFAVVVSTAMMQEIGLKRSSVTVYKGIFDQGEVVEYKGSITDSNQLLKFCEEVSQPVVFPYGENEFSYKLSLGETKLQHILFMDPKAPFFKETYRNFKDAAKTFMKNVDEIEVAFAHADPNDPYIERGLAYFHIKREDLPCNRVAKPDKFHSRFVPKKRDFSRQGFIDFTNDVLQGRVPRTVLSEPLPSDWDHYPLKILVGSNYEQYTRMKGIAVFVMYYIPDNKQCEEILPIVDELAMRFHDNRTVEIAVMDVSKNDGEVDVHLEYPSFRLFTADNRVKKFKGQKTLTAFKAFIDADGAPNYLDFAPNNAQKGGYEYEEQAYGRQDEDQYNLNYGERNPYDRRWDNEAQNVVNDAVKEMQGQRPDDDPYNLLNKNSDTDDNWNLDSAKFANLGDSGYTRYESSRSANSRPPDRSQSRDSGNSQQSKSRFHDEY